MKAAVTVERPRGLLDHVRPGSVIGNAASLFGTTIVTSLLGFAFWLVAARTFSQSAVGTGGAAVSAMQLIAMGSMLGLGTLLIGELSRGVPEAPRLISTALLTSAVVGLIAAVAFGLAARTVAHSPIIPGGVDGLVVFAVSAAVSAALLVLDDATVGLSRASWQFWRNLGFSAIKLAALPVGALGLALDGPVGILGSWGAGAVLSCAILWILARRARQRVLGRPRWALFRSYGRTALTHHWLNLSSGAPRLVLPVLVAAFLTPAANGRFYTAMLLVSFAYVVPTHLSTALFGVSSGDHRALGHELRRTVLLTSIVAAGAFVAFAVAGRLMLSLFGSGYGDAATPLAVLGTATFATGVKSFYTAVCRVNGDLGRAALVSSIGTAVEIALPAVALIAGGGLVLVAVAWVGAMFVEGVLLWPAVAAAGALPGAVSRFVGWTAPRTFAALAVDRLARDPLAKQPTRMGERASPAADAS